MPTRLSARLKSIMRRPTVPHHVLANCVMPSLWERLVSAWKRGTLYKTATECSAVASAITPYMCHCTKYTCSLIPSTYDNYIITDRVICRFYMILSTRRLDRGAVTLNTGTSGQSTQLWSTVFDSGRGSSRGDETSIDRALALGSVGGLRRLGMDSQIFKERSPMEQE